MFSCTRASPIPTQSSQRLHSLFHLLRHLGCGLEVSITVSHTLSPDPHQNTSACTPSHIRLQADHNYYQTIHCNDPSSGSTPIQLQANYHFPCEHTPNCQIMYPEFASVRGWPIWRTRKKKTHAIKCLFGLILVVARTPSLLFLVNVPFSLHRVSRCCNSPCPW